METYFCRALASKPCSLHLMNIHHYFDESLTSLIFFILPFIRMDPFSQQEELWVIVQREYFAIEWFHSLEKFMKIS